MRDCWFGRANYLRGLGSISPLMEKSQNAAHMVAGSCQVI